MTGLVFGIKARQPIAIILGFVYPKEGVIPLMQSISHSTRAYIVNSDGLPNFLIEAGNIFNYLQSADEAGHLEHARKRQVIDMSKV